MFFSVCSRVFFLGYFVFPFHSFSVCSRVFHVFFLGFSSDILEFSWCFHDFPTSIIFFVRFSMIGF